jgi:5-formyltetrahydrofolate cyclo-ligase
MQPDQAQRLSENICMQILENPALRLAQMVLTYIPVGTEANIGSAIYQLLDMGKSIISPPATASERINCFHFLAPGDPLLKPGGALIRQPQECDLMQISQIDFFLIPGLAFDSRGFRIGHGGGYFDKLLSYARPGAIKVGITFDFQIAERVPEDPWDVPVDLIITDKRAIECER